MPPWPRTYSLFCGPRSIAGCSCGRRSVPPNIARRKCWPWVICTSRILALGATWKGPIPTSASKAIERMLPEHGLEYRVVHRIAGLGSLGRERYVAIAIYRGGRIAREAKALAPSACVWADVENASARICYQQLLD